MPPRVARIKEQEVRWTAAGTGWLGHLAAPPGARPDDQIRAACDRCGAHVLVTRAIEGDLRGTCPVCLNAHFTQVMDPPAKG